MTFKVFERWLHIFASIITIIGISGLSAFAIIRNSPEVAIQIAYKLMYTSGFIAGFVMVFPLIVMLIQTLVGLFFPVPKGKLDDVDPEYMETRWNIFLIISSVIAIPCVLGALILIWNNTY
jgi:hypothetical protein